MQMASSATMRDRENGTGPLAASRAAVGGKLRDSNASLATLSLPILSRLIFAVATLLLAASLSYAQSGPFAGMAGVWVGGGTVSLDDGSSERIRCRATYAVGGGGAGLNMSLLCASDSYRFDLTGNLISDRGVLSGTWGESSRGINGTLAGRGANGNFQLAANAGGFNANLSLATRGNRQSVTITAQSGFRGASIALSRR
jgi:hypothetical protein